MPQANVVRINPMEATTDKIIPAGMMGVMFNLGSFSHLVPSLFGFVSGSHALQLLDPNSALTDPWGHLINAIPTTRLGDLLLDAWQAFNWTGRHRSGQCFPTQIRCIYLEFRRAVLVPVPIVTFLRRVSVAGESLMFMILYKAEKGSSNLCWGTFVDHVS